jgi:hypothetical protein
MSERSQSPSSNISFSDSDTEIDIETQGPVSTFTTSTPFAVVIPSPISPPPPPPPPLPPVFIPESLPNEEPVVGVAVAEFSRPVPSIRQSVIPSKSRISGMAPSRRN